jgi:hypothetical protein
MGVAVLSRSLTMGNVCRSGFADDELGRLVRIDVEELVLAG